jgi:two-component system chemotaxis response regulator CheY
MRALIVDDSHFIREFLRQNMERLGWECSEAADGQEGILRLRQETAAGNSFALMLVDVNMPRMDGLECVRRLREEGLAPAMQVMMVTTEADNRYIRRALENGANEFLMKPFSPQSLREKLALLGFDMVAA